MKILFIETPEFVNKFDKIASNLDMIDLQNELLANPYKGNIIQGTGGARKIRIKLKGRGKSGGGRVIYYYVDLQGEIWFLDIYTKSGKNDLLENEKKKIHRFIKEIIHEEFK